MLYRTRSTLGHKRIAKFTLDSKAGIYNHEYLTERRDIPNENVIIRDTRYTYTNAKKKHARGSLVLLKGRIVLIAPIICAGGGAVGGGWRASPHILSRAGKPRTSLSLLELRE